MRGLGPVNLSDALFVYGRRWIQNAFKGVYFLKHAAITAGQGLDTGGEHTGGVNTELTKIKPEKSK